MYSFLYVNLTSKKVNIEKSFKLPEWEFETKSLIFFYSVHLILPNLETYPDVSFSIIDNNFLKARKEEVQIPNNRKKY